MENAAAMSRAPSEPQRLAANRRSSHFDDSLTVRENRSPLVTDRQARRNVSSLVASPYSKGALVSLEDSLESNEYQVNDLLSSHERMALRTELKEYLTEKSRDVFEFIAPLETQIKKTVRSRKNSPELKRAMVSRVAELVSSVIRQIVQRETGVFTLEPNIAQMAATLFAGPAESVIIEGLYQRAQAVLVAIQKASFSAGNRESAGTGSAFPRQVRSVVDGYDVAREIEELTMLLRWYARRKSSLALVEWQTGVSGVETAMADDALFGLEVLHDHEVFGVRGCFVCGGLRLIGHDGQALWLRVTAESEGQPVTVRQGWDTWVDVADDSNLFGSTAPFAALVPIRPNAQRLIIDDVRCFIPYGAFDLPSGRSNVQLVVSLIDHNGEALLVTSQTEEICIPHHSDKATRAVSPHSIGMWPHDVVSGDRISNLRVSSGYSQIGHWEQLTVNVTCDLALFMHPGEPVVIECRFSGEDGSLVEVSPQGSVSSDPASLEGRSQSGSYRVRRIIRPRTAWASYNGLVFDVPVDYLYLEPGRRSLMCEVVVLSADDRILCGDLAAVDVVAPTPLRKDLPGSSLVSLSTIGPVSNVPQIELESLEVNPAYRFTGDDSVRVQATFCPRGAGSGDLPNVPAEFSVPYRVIISLEQNDGSPYLQGFSDELGVTYRPVTRSVCVEGSGSERESSVVCNFAHREVRWTNTKADLRQVPGKIQVFVRVRALTLDGQIFIDEAKEIFIKPEQGSDALKDVQFGEIRPGIVDAVAATYLQSKRFSARILLNLPARVAAREGVTVAAYLPTGAKSERVEIFRSVIAPRHLGMWSRAGLELVQVPVEFEGRLDKGAPILFFEVIGEFSEVIERLQQQIQVSEGSVTSEAVSGSVPDGSEESSRPKGEGLSEAKPARSFFAWLAGKQS